MDKPEPIEESAFWSRFGRTESSSVEFKAGLQKAGRMQEPLVAFANSRGGVVLVGVDEGRPRRVIGVQWGQEQEERVQEAARDTHPPLDVRTRLLDVDGRTVAAVEVAPLERGWVQTSDGRLLVRAGPTNRVLVGEQLLRFVQERGSEPAEDQRLPGTRPEDLDRAELDRYLRRRLGRRRVSAGQALRDLGLMEPDGALRLCALLMFGREPQRDRRRLGIEVVRFEGALDGRAVFRERIQLDGTLPELIEAADRVIADKMRRDAVIRGLVREEVPEFPSVAIREAIVNAVGHRSYAQTGASVQVRLYDDAVEIESPGTLAGAVTVENIREAQYSRNPRIMQLLHDLGFVEEAGTGVDRMVDAMEDALLAPPEFVERPHSFLVRFRGQSVFAAEDRLWIAGFAGHGLGPDARVALVVARRQAAVTNADLQELRGLPAARSREVLQALVARGLLVSVGRGRGTRYVLGPGAQEERAIGLDEHVGVAVAHARRNGAVANRDLRGLLGVDRETALRILEAGVAKGLLEAVGERRARRYVPAGSP